MRFFPRHLAIFLSNGSEYFKWEEKSCISIELGFSAKNETRF